MKLSLTTGSTSSLTNNIRTDAGSWHGQSFCRLTIHSGVRPTAAEFEAYEIGQMSLPNLLASFPWHTTTTETKINTGDANTVQISGGLPATTLTRVNPTLGGVATWFCFSHYAHALNRYDCRGFTGTVGGLGSGADLILTDTTLVVGEYITIATLGITYKHKFGY